MVEWCGYGEVVIVLCGVLVWCGRGCVLCVIVWLWFGVCDCGRGD